MDLYEIAARHVKAIVDLLNQHGPTDKIVLAAYNREEYNELHKAPGELSYDDQPAAVADRRRNPRGAKTPRPGRLSGDRKRRVLPLAGGEQIVRYAGGTGEVRKREIRKREQELTKVRQRWFAV